MKNLKNNWLLGLCLLTGIGPLNSQRVYTGLEAIKKHKNTELVRESQFSSLPSYIKFRKENQFDIDHLSKWMKDNFRFDPNIGFRLLRQEPDNLGHVHFRFQQTYNGVPIEDAIWIAHTKDNKVYSLNGLIYREITATSSFSISESAALELAKEYVGAEVYKWELPGEERHLKWEQEDPNATYFPTGEKVVISKNLSFMADDYRAAYKFNIYAHSPVSRAEIYVDANSGEILRSNALIHHADEEGVAHTAYSGEREIIADSFGGSYRLRDGSRGDGVRTFDMNEGTDYGDAVDFIDDDNDWNNINPQLDEYATDAHWGSEMTYDYFFLEHGRNSIDNLGFRLNSYVHYSVDFDNAFWDGERMTYGDGSVFFTPLTSIDVAGHEVTHGLTTYTANLIYSMESGALNESFSDIFGTAIEHYGRADDWDWLIGDDIGLTGPLRSMSNPNAEGDPDTYFGDFWAPLDGGDGGGVHTNSGVQNFWYYLLTEGGEGTNDNGDDYDVEALGFEASSAIAFRNLTVYLTPSSQFIDARFYAIQAAEDLFGGCTFEVEQTANAWYAVGVGDLYSPVTVAGFTTPDTDGCSLPHFVNFTNTSENGATYEWDFGDGSTSSEENPTHSYTEAGTYTVTLFADGGECGTDEIEMVDYIIVDPTEDCVVIMPESGGGSTQTSCEGTLFDSGGPDENYGSSEDAWITISPVAASSVTLDFISFDVEEGAWLTCNYDYLEVYDGPDLMSPLIGRYCNTIPPDEITSTGGSITLLFHSDAFLEEAGFEIAWSCAIPFEAPEAEFSVSSEESCNGMVHFTDLSTNSPDEWFWEFGDGSTSEEQHPDHTYEDDGVYTVTLTASNIVGEDVEEKIDYVVVIKPDVPSADGTSICEDEIATLTATGVGELKWYDDPMGTEPIEIGASLITGELGETTSYWVEDDVSSEPQFVGPTSNAFGGGGYFTGDQHLLFDNPSPALLKSVKVYANGAGNRTIELRDTDGSVLESLTVFIPNGENTVELDFYLPVGTNLQLGTELGSSPNLYRNDDGPSYPYEIDESVVITNSSAGDEYYYFFYNWEIIENYCVSDRIEVIVEVEEGTDANVDEVDDVCIQSSPFIINATEPDGTWSATCGACIDEVTGEFNPALAGEGSWVVTYLIDDICMVGNTTTVNVLDCLGLEDEINQRIKIYPNPTNGLITINTGNMDINEVVVKDVLGKTVFQLNLTDVITIVDLSQYQARGTYFVEFYDSGQSLITVKKIIKH